MKGRDIMSPELFVVVIALVCLLGFFNEKVTKLTYEISLMLFATASTAFSFRRGFFSYGFMSAIAI